MSAARRFTVMTTGNVEPGFDEDQVALDFISLLHTSPETAVSFVHSEQCVASDISEDRALAYQKSLCEIGLRVVLVQCEDTEAANEPVAASVSENEIPEAKQAAEVEVLTEAAQEQQNDLNTESAATTSGSHSGKSEFASEDNASEDTYIGSMPNAPMELIADSAEPVGVDLRPENELMHKRGNRTFRLALLFVIAAVLAGFIVATRSPVSVSAAKSLVAPSQFSQTARASEDITTLLDVSGMKADFEMFTDHMKHAHEEFFRPQLNSNTTLTQEKYDQLLELIPHAYNAQALHDTVGNQLQKTSFEADVVDLIKLYETPIVKRYVEISNERNTQINPDGFETFTASLQESGLSTDRRLAIVGLIDVLGLDTATFDIAGDLSRNLIATAGELRPDKDTQAAKDRVKDEIKAMRAQMTMSKPLLQDHTVNVLAWQLESFTTWEIQELRTAMDRSIARGFIRETTVGYESFLRDATFWLHRHLDDR